MNDRIPVGYVVSGSQKAGTTTLELLLRPHPQLATAPVKEWHYFDNERRDWTSGDASDYSVASTSPLQRTTGDATPLYLWWPQAQERMHRYRPDLRQIMLVRDPIERLVSQFQMVSNRWPKQATGWQEFCTALAPSGLEERIPAGVNVHRYRMQSGVVRGYYGAQLAHGHDVFGAESFLVVDFAELLADHRSVLRRVTDFIGVDPLTTVPELPHGMSGKPARSAELPDVADVAALVERYAADLELFERLSGVDIGAWPTRQVIEGRLTLTEFTQRLRRRFAQSPVPSPVRAGAR